MRISDWSSDVCSSDLPKVALRYFLRNCYHRPCDDADSQPIQSGDAAPMARLNARIGQLVAVPAEPPRLHAGHFSGRRSAPCPPAGRGAQPRPTALRLPLPPHPTLPCLTTETPPMPTTQSE